MGTGRGGSDECAPVSPLSAIPDLACLSAGTPPGLVFGVAAIDVATAAAGAPVPEWIKIAHRGDLPCRDGRSFTLDPEAIVARFRAHETDVAVDLGHATVTDHAAPALAYIQELAARPDGLYGRPDWLPGGKAVLAARTHRYVSPAFKEEGGQATWLHSVALVAVPALSNMPAVAAADLTLPGASPMKTVAAALGLQADAAEPAILTAVTTLQSTTVAKAVHDETLAQLAATSKELKELRDAALTADVERELEGALKDKKITPASKATLAKLAATPDGFVQVKALLASIAPGTVAGASGLEGRKAATGADAPRDAATLAAEANELAVKRGISFVDAMSIVSREKSSA